MTDKLKILILDDSEIILNMTALALMESGFDVATASSLQEFDKVLREKEPNIILTDIKMPEISGDDICRILKQKHNTKSIPIILFSTIEEKELAALTERSGADAYVCKGSGVEQIVNTINRLTEEMIF